MKYLIMIAVLSLSPVMASDFESEAKAFLMPIKKAFMGELKVGMKKGPYNAISSCHLKAPHLIEHDKSDKYAYGRTSLKIRNLQNSPKKWMLPILKEYAGSTASKPMAAKVYQVHGKQAYVEPIYVKAVCLNCHGKVRGSVKKRLKNLYPKDMALDYKVGQFRGLFWFKQK